MAMLPHGDSVSLDGVVESANLAAIQLHSHLVTTLADAAGAAEDANKFVPAYLENPREGWLGAIVGVLEDSLKFLEGRLEAMGVPYAYGFAIISLTLCIKLLTYPLTKTQVESSLAMQALSPQLKALQNRLKDDKEKLQLETARLYRDAGVNPLAGCLPTLATIPVFIGLYRALTAAAYEGVLDDSGFFWIPSLGGPTTIGGGLSWLVPFENGAPPVGYENAARYLILPVALVGSQYFTQGLMTPPTTDPQQQQTQQILKFLPLMIGYFSLTVPSGLGLYWFTNNLVTTAIQLYLRKAGGAQVDIPQLVVEAPKAGTARRTGNIDGSSPVMEAEVMDVGATTVTPEQKQRIRDEQEEARRQRFEARQALEAKKREERAKQAAAAQKAREAMAAAAAAEEQADGETTEEVAGEEAAPEGAAEEVPAAGVAPAVEAASSENGAPAAAPKRSRRRARRSKRKA